MEEVKIRGVWYIYVDYTADENKPFYVGKGALKRVIECERDNDHWHNIANKHGWHREIILTTTDESYAFIQEILGILEFGTFDKSSQYKWGANKTAGGEGCSGYKHTAECRREMSQSRIGKFVGSENWMFGKTGEAHPRFGTKHTPESNEKNRISNSGSNHPFFGKPRPADVAEKIRIGNSGENSNNTSLTWIEVNAIRDRFDRGDCTLASLAKEYKISRCAVSNIVYGKTWKSELSDEYLKRAKELANKNRAAKAQNQSGELNPVAKLTWPQVNQIRTQYAIGDRTLVSIAKEHKIKEQHVWAIVHFKTWKTPPAQPT